MPNTATKTNIAEYNAIALKGSRHLELPAQETLTGTGKPGTAVTYIPFAHDQEGRITAIAKGTNKPKTETYIRLEINLNTNKKKIIGITFDRNNKQAFEVLKETIELYNGM